MKRQFSYWLLNAQNKENVRDCLLPNRTNIWLATSRCAAKILVGNTHSHHPITRGEDSHQ
ncbi:hypothetical protein CU097_006357, partial [Rhizopus azygosporus]